MQFLAHLLSKISTKNNDYNVKQLLKILYQQKISSQIVVERYWRSKGSSIGHRDIEFTFVENQEENIFFTDSLEFTSSENY
ncbi:Csa1 family protein [Staphylococcus aureus]